MVRAEGAGGGCLRALPPCLQPHSVWLASVAGILEPSRTLGSGFQVGLAVPSSQGAVYFRAQTEGLQRRQGVGDFLPTGMQALTRANGF